MGHFEPHSARTFLRTLRPSNTFDTAARFSGSRLDLAKLLALGVILQAITFGFYRFWLETDVRRHLWSNTRIGVEAFEYTGTGRELLLGFLKALAISAPASLTTFAVGFWAQSLHDMAGLVSGAIFLIMIVLASFAAWRYRASRTAFRGVRFRVAGSLIGYLMRWLFWTSFTVLTLGLAWPWRKAALERYLIGNTHYGTLRATFSGTGEALARAVAGPLLTMAAGLLCLLINTVVGAALITGAAIWSVVAMPVATTRWRIENTRFGNIHFTCRPRRRAFAIALALFVVSVILIASITFMGLAVSAVALGIDITAGTRSPALMVLLGLTCLPCALSLGAAKRLFVERGFWAATLAGTTIEGLLSLEDVQALDVAEDGTGEELLGFLAFEA